MAMMNRMECFRALARHVTDEIVVSSYSSAHDWIALGERPLNHFSHGAMGLGSSHGLGLALGLPERRVVVLDGDGSLLMNLGTLVTIAGAAPKNLLLFVCQNGSYEANGGHPLPNVGVDFAGMARSAGIRACYAFSELPLFEAQIGAILQEQGPVFVVLKVEQGPHVEIDYPRLYDPARRAALREAVRR